MFPATSFSECESLLALLIVEKIGPNVHELWALGLDVSLKRPCPSTHGDQGIQQISVKAPTGTGSLKMNQTLDTFLSILDLACQSTHVTMT